MVARLQRQRKMKRPNKITAAGQNQGFAWKTGRVRTVRRSKYEYPLLTTTPTGVTNATPGAFTPAGSGVYDLTRLRALGALGETVAWSAGQYVLLGNGTKAHWDGDSFEAGPKP